jgi:hypothetical protein
MTSGVFSKLNSFFFFLKTFSGKFSNFFLNQKIWEKKIKPWLGGSQTL